MSLRILSIISLLFFGFTVESSNKVYRVIRASPNDFVSALRISPTNQVGKKEATSRLSKFFRLKNKRVVGKSIEMEVIPDLPLLDEYFPDIKLLHLKMNETISTGKSFQYTVFFMVKNNEVIQAEMFIIPHALGSLLTLDFNKTNYPEWTVAAFLTAASNLGFVAKSAEEAVKAP